MKIKKADQIKKLRLAIKMLNNRVEESKCEKTRVVLTGRMFAYEACLKMIETGDCMEIDLDGM